MPLPRPHSNETQDTFISRCMEIPLWFRIFRIIINELAVCYGIWKRSKKEEDITEEVKTDLDNAVSKYGWEDEDAT